MAVGAVVISQGVGYCEYQGVAPVNFFLDSVEGGGVAGPGSRIPGPPLEDRSTGGGGGRLPRCARMGGKSAGKLNLFFCSFFAFPLLCWCLVESHHLGLLGIDLHPRFFAAVE